MAPWRWRMPLCACNSQPPNENTSDRSFVPAFQAIAELSPSSSAPVFGIYPPSVGAGIVGGVMMDPAACGREIAETARSVIGLPPSSMLPFAKGGVGPPLRLASIAEVGHPGGAPSKRQPVAVPPTFAPRVIPRTGDRHRCRIVDSGFDGRLPLRGASPAGRSTGETPEFDGGASASERGVDYGSGGGEKPNRARTP